MKVDIVYIYLQNKYSSKNKDLYEIKYIVPPVTYEDYFQFKDLAKHYNTMFGTSETNSGFTAFSGTNTITGGTSGATLTPSSTTETVTLANSNTLSLTTGYANTELQPDSGNILYLENRKPIQRDSDQTEDIKLIIEF